MSRRLPPGAKWITLPSGARRVELVLDVGEDQSTGQRRQIRRRFKTVEEATEAQADLLKQAREGSYVSRANLTVEQACADWLAGRRLRKGTLANYANSLKPLRRTYGAQPLQALTKKQVNELINRLQAGQVPRADERTPRPWQPSTINLMLRVLVLHPSFINHIV
jgi:Arm DNA-binding domain